VVRQPYSGREVVLLARDHSALLGDDYDIASLVEAIEYRRKREVGNLLLLANLIAYAFNDPKKMPTLDDLLYEKQPAPPPTRDEWNALKARMKG
jgi:hypothetical protein